MTLGKVVCERRNIHKQRCSQGNGRALRGNPLPPLSGQGPSYAAWNPAVQKPWVKTLIILSLYLPV